MTENILIAVTFLFGMLVFALVLALACIAWFALNVLRMCERYRANVRRFCRRSLPAGQRPGERWARIQLRPFYQRLILSYRGWRVFGLGRVDALRGAWLVSRRAR